MIHSVLCLVIFGTHLNVLKDKCSKTKLFACRKSRTAGRRSLCYKFCIYCFILSNASYLLPVTLRVACQGIFFLNRKLSDKLTLCKCKGLVTSHLVHSFIFLIWNLCYIYRLKICFQIYCFLSQPYLKTFLLICNCWFSHDVTKFQTSELLILLRFYFHDVLEQLKTNIQTNFHSEWVLGLVIDHAWISKLLRDVAFTWRARELLCWFKRWLISGNSAIWTILVLE